MCRFHLTSKRNRAEAHYLEMKKKPFIPYLLRINGLEIHYCCTTDGMCNRGRHRRNSIFRAIEQHKDFLAIILMDGVQN